MKSFGGMPVFLYWIPIYTQYTPVLTIKTPHAQ